MLAILFASFLLLVVVGIDVGFAMILSAWLGIELKPDNPVSAVLLPTTLVTGVSYYALVQIPLFILAGEIMNQGGLTKRLIDWSSAMVGGLRGSLGHVTIVTNTVMAGISGSAVADAVATGRPLIPAMRERGYGAGFAGAAVAAGALLGPIIPPSIPMVVYAQLANQSVIRLFMAGLVPGLLLAAGFFAICSLVARARGFETSARTTAAVKARATARAAPALLLPVIILLGIRAGLFTDTEVAAVAVTYALVVSLILYRDIRIRDVPKLFFEAGRGSAMILFLLAAAGPFSWLVAESGVATAASGWIAAQNLGPAGTLLLVNVFLLVVGCLIEPLPAMIIFLPALLPIGQAAGIDPIQYGAVLVINLMIGMLTPPVGLLLFVVSSVGRIPMGQVVRDVLPFLAWALVVLGLISTFPPLTLALAGR
jgi:tripartite ATP-independent transporter DctM subunit